jgi:enoyl-CoA hydratase
MSETEAERELEVEVRDGRVAIVTLRRPRRLNALSWPLIDELLDALARIGEDPAIRVVVLTGAGRGFCAGLDIQADDPFGQRDPIEAVFGHQEKVAGLALALRALPQPVIAAVNGPASGGGLALALACDLRVAVPEASFNVAFVRIGLSGCDVGVSHLLPRIVGFGIASELMLTGARVDAARAERIGLVNRVAAPEELLDAALALAAEIARNSPFGVRMTKEVLERNVDATSLAAAIDLENRTQVIATRTANAAEALSAFTERREPRFGG